MTRVFRDSARPRMTLSRRLAIPPTAVKRPPDMGCCDAKVKGRGAYGRPGNGDLRAMLALALLEDERVALARDLAQRVHDRAGARRDQPADNDVLLEPLERVVLAVDGRLGEHARGLLERRRRDERAGLQARLGD